MIELGQGGGWQPFPEFAVDSGIVRSRSIDVVLLRPHARKAILCEIWDWFDDVGASLRSLDGKRAALIARLDRDTGDRAALIARLDRDTGDRESWTVRCLFVVRRTRRNERLLTDLRPIFAARFPGSARGWLSALTQAGLDIPKGDGLLWSTGRNEFQASRLGGKGPA